MRDIWSRERMPRDTAAAPIRSGSMPRPSSVISMTTWPLSWKARSATRPRRVLARRNPVGGAFDPVVERVADQVGQGSVERLEERPVELGVVALELEVDLACRS